MNKYTLDCTEEQTRKALELGAPIEILPNYTEYRGFPLVKCQDGNDRPCIIPTAEQMTGWLEEQGIEITISNFHNEHGYTVSKFENNFDESIAYQSALYSNNFSRKEATLAAIDAALEYLMTIKLNKK